jgi:hypothetical protein
MRVVQSQMMMVILKPILHISSVLTVVQVVNLMILYDTMLVLKKTVVLLSAVMEWTISLWERHQQ